MTRHELLLRKKEKQKKGFRCEVIFIVTFKKRNNFQGQKLLLKLNIFQFSARFQYKYINFLRKPIVFIFPYLCIDEKTHSQHIYKY